MILCSVFLSDKASIIRQKQVCCSLHERCLKKLNSIPFYNAEHSTDAICCILSLVKWISSKWNSSPPIININLPIFPFAPFIKSMPIFTQRNFRNQFAICKEKKRKKFSLHSRDQLRSIKMQFGNNIKFTTLGIHIPVVKVIKLLTWFWTTWEAVLYRSRINFPGSPVQKKNLIKHSFFEEETGHNVSRNLLGKEKNHL